jgi:hypothetical protein
MTKNLKKILLKKIHIFLSKIAIYLSLGLHKALPSYKKEKPSALRREHPALQNMKSKHEISLLFSILWVIFALLEPDPKQ